MKLHNKEDMKTFARELAKKKYPLLLLFGELGAGKTTFTKAYGEALGIQEIKSPTFSIVEEHPYAHGVFYHMDLYRIEDEEELYALGFEEYFDRPGCIVIEWPQVGLDLIPRDAYCLEILSGEGEEREVRLGTREDFGV